MAKTGVLPDPAVLVIRRPGVVEATLGVTDRETVAQAVAQARARRDDDRGRRPARTPAASSTCVMRASTGSSVAILRAIELGDSCIVEAEVWPVKGHPDDSPLRPGPYSFRSPVEATRFVTHAVEALIVLGCEVHAS